MLLFGKTSHDLRLATLTARRFIWHRRVWIDAKSQNTRSQPGERELTASLFVEDASFALIQDWREEIERLIKKLELRRTILPTQILADPDDAEAIA